MEVTSRVCLPDIDYDDLEFYECLSSGTFGTVYRAKFKKLGIIVAVKRLLVLEKEAHILSLVRHRNVVHFFGAVTKPPNFCIVTEFASNGSLYDVLHDQSRSDLSYDTVLRWAIDVATGVHYLHFEAPDKILHRDLKSKNVVISADNICKLCDFGTARPVVQTTRMTYGGGTMPWMSPEMIKCEPVSGATDAWSYGVVLWELLTRETPFNQLESFRIAWKVVEENYRLTIPKSCPEPFAELLTHCWQTEPKSRPNFREILDVLHSIRSNGLVSRAAIEFLRNRSLWKTEISEEMDRMKLKERDLNEKQTKLCEWEMRLLRREQKLEHINQANLPSYDVNRWTEEDVAVWLLKLNPGAEDDRIQQLATVFLDQHINGERLLLLTDIDLMNMGVSSVGYRRQLLNAVMRLNLDNRRLINFPPLEAAVQPLAGDRSPRTSALQGVELQLLICFICRPGTTASLHRWKLMLELDYDKLEMDLSRTIEHVRFVLPMQPYVYTVKRAPYVMREWITGLEAPVQVQCVVTFSDLVRQPRNTTIYYDVEFGRSGMVTERSVQLQLKKQMSVRQTSSNNSHPLSSSTLRHSSYSSPSLSSAWSTRTFSDAVPTLPMDQSGRKSALWADIVSGLLQPTPSPSRRTSGPLECVYERQPFGQRTVSDDPNARNRDAKSSGNQSPRAVTQKNSVTDITSSNSSSSTSSVSGRRGRIRYSRNSDSSRVNSQRLSTDGIVQTLISEDESETPRDYNEAKVQSKVSSSVMSMQVHGGNQKWKWKSAAQ